MRNLKKILALVLALMMVLSVMVFASAANYDDYSDKDQVSPEYAEAVEVLTGMDIFWGSENSFYPKENVSRAEVATLLYRIMTTDVSGSQVGIYKDYGMFDDVLETNWFAGYVNYSANNEYVVGVGDNNYNPNGNVTGYEWITMLLRAIGYDQNNEISGSTWKITAAGLAQEAGILDGFNQSTLNSALTREEVAYLLFNAINARQVTYTPAFGYDDDPFGTPNPSIGQEQFNLTYVADDSDIWGRPGYGYTYNTGDLHTVIEQAPVAVYNTAVTECDVADDLGIHAGSVDLTVYTNGARNVSWDTVSATERVDTIGDQGRITEIYEANGVANRIVYIDTFVGVVTGVTARTYDAAGHVASPATLTYSVYGKGYADTGVSITETNYAADYTFTVGSVLAVNKVTGASYLNGNTTEFPVVSRTLVSASVVTVNAITQNAAQGNVGFVGTNGTRYLYNCTYADASKLGTSAIGSSYYVWTDSHGNVLLVSPVGTTDAGYGVFTALDVESVGLGQWVIVANVLQADGSTATVRLEDGSSKAPYATQALAEAAAVSAMNANGHYLAGYEDTDGDGYYDTFTNTSSVSVTTVDAGEADTLGTSALVNDNTVFFVANYTYDYGKTQYVRTGYTVVTGFKNIQDLTNDSTVDATFEDGEHSSITVTTLNTGNNAYAVLVEYANKQSVPATVAVDNYAYLITDKFVDISNDTRVYTAIINGVPNQSLTVTAAAAQNIISGQTGLYTYTNQTTNGYDTVTKSSNTATAGTYSYAAGVLTITGTPTYKTVANNCAVYLINPTTGTSVATNLSALAQYGATCDITYQLDANGYISLIYIVEA